MTAQHFSSSAFHNPREAVQLLLRKRIPVPREVIQSEMSRVLHSIFSDFLNSEGNSLLHLPYLADLLYNSSYAEDRSTALGDTATEIAVKAQADRLPDIIAAGYAYWHEWISAVKPRVRAEQKANAQWKNFQEKYTAPGMEIVMEFCAKARELLSGFCMDVLIHGSISDMKKTPYSDLDTLIIVKKETLEKRNRLLELRNNVQAVSQIVRKFDPLQHHGMFVACELDLDGYCESRFPLVLLDTATSLMDAPVLRFTLLYDNLERAQSLFSMAGRILAIKELPRDPYLLKLLSSWVMLLPAMHHQMHRGTVYKPDSFNAVKGDFSERAWQAVESATRLREKWKPENVFALMETLDPAFCAHAHALAEEAIGILTKSEISDPCWDEVNAADNQGRVPVAFHPVNYSREEFFETRMRLAENLCAVEGVRSVYGLGKSEPTPGISDLDFLAVLENDPTISAEAAKAFGKICDTKAIPRIKPLDSYLQWHEPVTLDQNEFKAFWPYWMPPPVFLAGADDSARMNPKNPEEEWAWAAALLFKEGYFQFFKLMELALSGQLPLRIALLRIHSILYDIKISEKHFGNDPDKNKDFISEIVDLRNQWFRIKENVRISRLETALQKSIPLLFDVLSRSAADLEAKGKVSIDPIRNSAPFVQSIGPFRVIFTEKTVPKIFSGASANKTIEVEMPLNILPLAVHCRPFPQIHSKVKMPNFRGTLSQDLSKVALALRRMTEKYLTLGKNKDSAPADLTK